MLTDVLMPTYMKHSAVTLPVKTPKLEGDSPASGELTCTHPTSSQLSPIPDPPRWSEAPLNCLKTRRPESRMQSNTCCTSQIASFLADGNRPIDTPVAGAFTRSWSRNSSYSPTPRERGRFEIHRHTTRGALSRGRHCCMASSRVRRDARLRARPCPTTPRVQANTMNFVTQHSRPPRATNRTNLLRESGSPTKNRGTLLC